MEGSLVRWDWTVRTDRHAQFLVQLVRRSLGARDERLCQGCRLTHGDQRAAEHVAFSTSHEIAAAAQRIQDCVTRRDVSLLGVGMWQLQPDITHAKLNPEGGSAVRDSKAIWNPLSSTYRTRDGRFIILSMLDADRYWADFCEVIGHPELIADLRFVDMPARKANARACVEFVDEVFAARDYKEWCVILEKAKGVWAPLQTPLEVHSDPQVKANGYLADVEMANGSQLTLVTSPAQFDEEPARPTRAPEQGEHTEAVLLNLGLSWEEIAKLKERAVIG